MSSNLNWFDFETLLENIIDTRGDLRKGDLAELSTLAVAGSLNNIACAIQELSATIKVEIQENKNELERSRN
ncbi:MAG: hypothetical protein ACW99J_15155 [Candidatus Thorarchaeota archaeon]|jgi:hypothetical protein